MNQVILSAIGLIKSAITGEAVYIAPKSHGMAARLLTEQGSVNLAYVGLLNCGVSNEKQPMQVMMDQYCMGVLHSEKQLSEIKRICDALEKNGFDYMPVKGALMKHMYPTHELRPMSDADILIREEEYAGIRAVMQSLGYEEVGESDHEHIWKNAHLKVELHKRLIPSYNKDYYSYFGEGWDLAKIQDGHRWSMTQEDAFIYNFIHFAKHYRDGDVDCRFVVDIWVHLRHYPQMDMAYVRRELGRLQMLTFLDNILRVVDVWFQDGPWDERTERITNVLFYQNDMERAEAQQIAWNTREAEKGGSAGDARRRLLYRRIFPTRQVMNWSHPHLKKLPLPIAWVARWCILLVHGPKKKTNNRKVSQQQIEHYRQDLEYVGLQFSDNVALPE